MGLGSDSRGRGGRRERVANMSGWGGYSLGVWYVDGDVLPGDEGSLLGSGKGVVTAIVVGAADEEEVAWEAK